MINAIEQTTPSTPTNTTNTTMPQSTKAPKATTTKTMAAEASITDTDYQPDDWVTKPQIMAKFGIPNGDRQVVHHAIIRAKLQPASNSKGPKDVRFRFADALNLFERGEFTRESVFVARGKRKNKPELNAGTETDDVAAGIPIDDNTDAAVHAADTAEARDSTTESAEGTVTAGTDDAPSGGIGNADAAAGDADDVADNSYNVVETDAGPGSDLEPNQPVTVEEHPNEDPCIQEPTGGGDGANAMAPEETTERVGGTLVMFETDAAETLSANLAIDPEVASEIARVEQMLANLPSLTNADLITSLNEYARSAQGLAHLAVKNGNSAVIHAWACGTLLNSAKARCGHGNFIRWLEEHVLPRGGSKATCERYMGIAKKYPDVRMVAGSHGSLNDLYLACGILKKKTPAARSAAPGAESEANEDSHAAAAALRHLAGAQREFRRLANSGKCVSREILDQASLSHREVGNLLAKLCDDTNIQTAA